MKALQAAVVMAVLALTARAEPLWSLAAMPTEWPRQADGSNALVACVSVVEAEVAKAQHFLAAGNYHILQGGLKGDPPHVNVQHPDNPNSRWTIFFKPADKAIGQIVKGEPGRYVIMLNDGGGRHYASYDDRYLEWGASGKLKSFGHSVGDQLKHQVEWRDDGRIAEEHIYNWANRGRTIREWTKEGTPIYTEVPTNRPVPLFGPAFDR